MSNSRSLTRPNYFSGKLLTVDDLKQEQTYFLEKFKRHNRTLHGFGIAVGLRVSTDLGKIKISSGMALDCEGNEIVVCSDQDLLVPALKFDVAFVNIRYSEHYEGVVPSGEPAAITESFELSLDKYNENRGHRHERARWLSCGKPHSLTLARLRRGPRGWRIDRRYRAPVIKY